MIEQLMNLPTMFLRLFKGHRIRMAITISCFNFFWP